MAYQENPINLEALFISFMAYQENPINLEALFISGNPFDHSSNATHNGCLRWLRGRAVLICHCSSLREGSD
jgi:hypothetical protein